MEEGIRKLSTPILNYRTLQTKREGLELLDYIQLHFAGHLNYVILSLFFSMQLLPFLLLMSENPFSLVGEA